MNDQRIQELRKVAVQQADNEVAHLERVHNRRYLIGEWSAIFSDKFAELIVRECMSICEDNDNDCASGIGKYFGVK